MGKYRVTHGVHNEDGKRYKKGEIVESPLKLSEIFRQKFVKLSNDATPTAKPKKAPETPAKEVVKETAPKPQPSPYGDDVTGLFKTAEENGFKVFKKRNWLTVADEKGEPLNEKGLRADDVEAWISKYLEDGESK